jgi:hypothetical protein
MQYVNDDMDELFRRAAENYPLDTNSADWNKVLTALQGETEAKTSSANKKNGRLLWLLLLLPLGLICNRLYSPGVSNSKEISTATAANKNSTVDSKTIHQQDNNTGRYDINRNETTVVTNGHQSQNNNNQADNFSVSSVENKTSFNANSAYLKNKNKNFKDQNDIFSPDKQTKNNESYNNDLFTNEPFQRKFVSEIDLQDKITGDFETIVTKGINSLFNSSEENSKQNIRLQRRKKFYAGVISGVDATTIKFQKIQNAGATYGALVGYQINKKWSVESGVFLEKKYYYTEGKYFNTSKVPIPSNWRIDNVSGNCKMFEVPVLLKYNFSAHKNSNWFATAGTSSYFMKKQSYSYDYYYGSWGRYTRSIPYDSSSTYLFSNISLSIGYSHRLGNFADLRIEPYLKLPVSKVGVGNLPLFSTGLQIDITKKF